MEQELLAIREGSGPLVQTTMKRRRFEVYPLLKQELRQLAAGYSSPALALCGIFIGAAVGFVITDLTVTTLTPQMANRFADFTFLSVGLAAVSGVRAFFDWRKSCRIIADIEKETVEVDVIQPASKQPS